MHKIIIDDLYFSIIHNLDTEESIVDQNLHITQFFVRKKELC